MIVSRFLRARDKRLTPSTVAHAAGEIRRVAHLSASSIEAASGAAPSMTLNLTSGAG